MKYEIEDIEDILFDGSDSEIKDLSSDAVGADVQYEYSASNFTVRFGNQISSMHNPHYEPNCVSVFGLKHVFS